MRFLFLAVSFVIVSFALTGCQTSKSEKLQTLNFHIIDVEVLMLPAVKVTDSFTPKMQNALLRYAAEYNATKAGRVEGYTLQVQVTKVHFKNPIASLLVGDGNHIQAVATVLDPDDGTQVEVLEATFVDGASVMLNGISGAVLSVAVKKEAAESTLTKGLAGNVMKKVFPDTSLPEGAKKRLSVKVVHQPPEKPISPMAPDLPSEDVDDTQSVATSHNGTMAVTTEPKRAAVKPKVERGRKTPEWRVLNQ